MEKEEWPPGGTCGSPRLVGTDLGWLATNSESESSWPRFNEEWPPGGCFRPCGAADAASAAPRPPGGGAYCGGAPKMFEE